MYNFLNKKVLLLNSSYEAIMAINVKRAIILLFLEKAVSVNDSSRKIHSEKFFIHLPTIVKLREYIHVKRKDMPLTRKNIFERDNNTCQYCGKINCQLTIDHVIPKQKGGKDLWDNLVTSCTKCNSEKGNYLLNDSKMILLKRPKKPQYLLHLQKYAHNEYTSWKPYLFMERYN